jgi:hypothetical protein
MKKSYKATIIWVIVAIIAFVGGWYIGKSTSASSTGRGAFASSTRGGFAGRAGGAGGGFVAGTVSAIDSDSITLQLANGNSENVFYSSSTSVIEPMPASISSVTPGTMVMIGGTTDSSGNLTASSIQIRSAGSGSGYGGGTAPTGGTQ